MPAIITQAGAPFLDITDGTVHLDEGADSKGWLKLPGEFFSNMSITDHQDLYVHAFWKASGPGHFFLVAPNANWVCTAHLELMGNAEYTGVANQTIVPCTGTGSGNYTTSIRIPAGLAPGVYRVVLTIGLVFGATKIAFGGFSDVGLVNVMEDGM